MAVAPRPTWRNVTLEQVKKMDISELRELSEARKRDKAAEQAAASGQATTSEPQPLDNDLPNGKAAAKSSQGPQAATSSQVGPTRSPRRHLRMNPYSRAEGPKKDSNGEANGASATSARSRINGPFLVPSQNDHDEASEESIEETTALISRLQKELNELEEENRVVLETAKNARMVAARLKEKLAYERAKTDRVVDFLNTWYKTHEGRELDHVSHKEDASMDEAAIDELIGAANLTRLKREFATLSKEEFSGLKRSFAKVKVEKANKVERERQEAKATKKGPGSSIADNDVNGKGKGKDKGKGKERSDFFDATLPFNVGKDKGKAKEDPRFTDSSFPKSAKRTWSELQRQTNPALLASEEDRFAEAQRRSRLETSMNPETSASGARLSEASGSRTRLPEASGSGTRLPEANGDTTQLPAEPVAADEEPQRKRRKVHWDKATPGFDSSAPSFLKKAVSFGQQYLGHSLWPGIPVNKLIDSSKPHSPRRYLSIVKSDEEFNEATELVFTWDRASKIPNIQLPEPDAPNYVSEIQRAYRFLRAGPPGDIVPSEDLFKLDPSVTLPYTEHGRALGWNREGNPVIHLPDVKDPNFLPLLLYVGQELGDYDASIPRSRRMFQQRSGGLHCSWHPARRPQVILPPPEDPNYVVAIREAAKFILRGPGPGDVWQPSITGFFKVHGKPLPDLSSVSVNRRKDGSLSVLLPQHTVYDYVECILSADEWIKDLLGED